MKKKKATEQNECIEQVRPSFLLCHHSVSLLKQIKYKEYQTLSCAAFEFHSVFTCDHMSRHFVILFQDEEAWGLIYRQNWLIAGSIWILILWINWDDVTQCLDRVTWQATGGVWNPFIYHIKEIYWAERQMYFLNRSTLIFLRSYFTKIKFQTITTKNKPYVLNRNLKYSISQYIYSIYH